MNAESPGAVIIENIGANFPPLPASPEQLENTEGSFGSPVLSPRSKSRSPRGRRFYLIPWWVALLFTLGCILFVISSSLGFGKLSGPIFAATLHINLAGSSCFLLGGIMSFIETLTKKSELEVWESIEKESRVKRKKGPPKPTGVDIGISVTVLCGTVCFEVPAITIYYFGAAKWFEKFLYINLHYILGVIFFFISSLLAFYKFYDHPFVFKPKKLPYYPPFLFILGGFPFIVYAILATLDTYYQFAATSMSLMGSVFYLGGSIAMQVEIILADDDGRQK